MPKYSYQREKQPSLCLGFSRFHEFRWLRGIRGIHKLRHDERELFEGDRFRNVRVEAGFDALRVYITENIGRESNDRMAAVAMLLLPASDLFAGLIAIFIWHVQIALKGLLVFCKD